MQKDNGDIPAKVLLREWAIKELGGIEKVRVMEAFGGQGVLHDKLYTKAKQHIAFDIKKIDRPTWIQGDAKTLVQANIKHGWDLYDIDAYANPWEIARDVARLANPGKFAVVCTCGLARGLGSGVSNGFIRKMSGLNGLSDIRLAGRWYDDIIRWCAEDWAQFGVQIKATKRILSIQSTAWDIWYWGFLVTKG